MTDTKEKILQAALRLFAQDGYEAVSVSTIAGEIGVTKPALYKHYKSKQDIFDSIVERMKQNDEEQATAFDVPVGTFQEMPEACQGITFEKMEAFSLGMFEYWTQDEFASRFRRMLILEQYRNPDMAELYQQCLAKGIVAYTEDLFHEMMTSGAMKQGNAKLLALQYCAPLNMLIGMSDTSQDNEILVLLLKEHIKSFKDTHAKGGRGK